MAKNSITDYDKVSANNTDVQSVDISEGCSPSGINNAIREVMADLADVNDGTVALTSPQAGSLTVTGDLTVDTDTLYVDSTNNRVGVGTTSPAYKLDINGGTDNTILRLLSTDDTCEIILTDNDSSSTIAHQNGDLTFNADSGNADPASSEMKFQVDGTERMRIDTSGNLLVGTTTTSGVIGGSTVAGSYLSPDGGLFASRSGDAVAHLNRQTSDGEIVEFRKDGSTVGSIQSIIGARLGVFTGSTAGYLGIGTTQYYAWNATDIRPQTDNARDLGYVSARWDDVYATNGTIQTSDENEKQQIASLTDAEITAAKAISKLFKTFKWNDKVEAKGDAARTHTGVIAQHVETAMTDAGLDAGDYAFFISTDWHEDADGNEVEADAEGAIAKNRKGIRYPELLAFIGAATEQRLADIETRLTALENA